MYDSVLLNFILALATNELMHNVAEINGIRSKLKRLEMYIDNQPYKEMKIKIDTRLKSYAVALGIFLVVTIIMFGFYTWLNLTLNSALFTLLILLLASFATTTALVDRTHVEFERITRPFMKKTKQPK